VSPLVARIHRYFLHMTSLSHRTIQKNQASHCDIVLCCTKCTPVIPRCIASLMNSFAPGRTQQSSTAPPAGNALSRLEGDTTNPTNEKMSTTSAHAEEEQGARIRKNTVIIAQQNICTNMSAEHEREHLEELILVWTLLSCGNKSMLSS